MKDRLDSDRARKILNHPHARGIESFARHLALQTDLPTDQAIGALEACQQDLVNNRVKSILKAGMPEGGPR